VVTSQVIFQGPEQVVVWGGQIQTVGWMGEQFSAILCSSVPVSKRGNQQQQTFRYLRISIIFWTARCPTPSCAALYLTSFGFVWWARRLFACYAQLQRFSVDHSAADRRCPCFRP
jgi:hypothetical protein